MALDAVVFPQGLLTHRTREQLCSMAGAPWIYELTDLEDAGNSGLLALECEAGGGGFLGSCSHGTGASTMWAEGFDGEHVSWNSSCPSNVARGFPDYDIDSSSPEAPAAGGDGVESSQSPRVGIPTLVTARCRRKRRRTKSCKNEEEVQNQRMTHIAVERNRRKQMNEYLAALRSLMPASYVQRGDQASIVGGAINFVKELEQLLQSLEAQKRIKQKQQQHVEAVATDGVIAGTEAPDHDRTISSPEVEVTMVDSHANLKVLCPQRPQQLLMMVTGLQGIRLTTLHLNVTTVHQMVRYTFSLKVEDDCQLSSVEEIATAVHRLLGKIPESSF